MATVPSSNITGARRRRIRRILFFLVPLILLAIGWQVVKQLVDIERYRGTIDTALEELLELPLDFGAMELRLLPTPRLVVEDVTLGEGDFMAHAPRVSVTAGTLALLRRQLDLRTVTIRELRIQMPASVPDFSERWRDYLSSLGAPSPRSGSPMIRVTLAEIVAPDLAVFLGDQRVATGALTVSDVTAGAPRFTYTLAGTGMAGEPRAEGALTLTVKADPRLEGTATVSGLPLSSVTGDQRLPAMLLDGDLDYRLAPDNRFIWNTAGAIRYEESDSALGDFTFQGDYGAGDLALRDLIIDSDPVAFAGTLELPADQPWNLAIERAKLAGDGVNWLLAYLPALPLHPGTAATPRCVLENMRIGAGPARLTVARGTLRTEGIDVHLGDAPYVLSGLSSEISVSDNVYTIERIAGDYGRLSGMLQVVDEATVTLDLEGELRPGPDFPLPPALADAVRLEGGTIDVTQFSTVFTGGKPEFGTTRLALVMRDGAAALRHRGTGEFTQLDGMAGGLLMEGGRIRLDQFSVLGSEVSGHVEPDEVFERWTFAASLKSDLSGPVWKPFYPGTQISIARGAIDCPEVTGAYTRSDGQFHDLQVAGQVTDLVVAIALDEYEDAIAIDTVNLSASGDHITYVLTGKSERVGALSADGTFAPGAGVADGSLRFNPAHALRPLMAAGEDTGFGGALLARLDNLDLRFRYARDGRALAFDADVPLTLSGALNLAEGGGVDELTFAAGLPLAWFADALPDALMTEGTADLDLRYVPRTGALAGTVNLTKSTVAWRALAKPEGMLAMAEFAGDWQDGALRDTTGRAYLGTTMTPIRYGDRGLASDALDLALTALAPIFPPGASLEGHLRGGFTTTPPRIALQADRVAVQAGEDFPRAGLHGALRWEAGTWEMDALQVSLGDQEAVLSAGNRGGPWSGTASAATFAPDRAMADYKTLSQWWSGEPGDSHTPRSAPSDTAAGTFQLAADSVSWGGASVDAFTATLTLEPGARRLSDMQFKSGAGRGNGSANFALAAGESPARLDLDLTLQAVDLGLIERLLGGGAREMHGTMDGRAALSFPLPADGAPPHHNASGTVEFSGRNGTLGKAGLASKFLAALRTTDILRMRLPSLRDKGVTFTTLSGSLAIESGRYTLSPYHMEDTTYALDAAAVLDFPADTAAGLAELQVLDGVTGLASRIPILGNAADRVNKAFGVELRISGSAKDPTFRAGRAGPLRSLEDGARILLQETQKLVGQ